MKILLMAGTNLADALSQILSLEGHDITATNDHPGTRRHGTKTIGFRDGRIDHLINEPWDLVLCPDTVTNREGISDMFRRRGVPTIGAGQAGFRLELKDVGRKAFEEAGLKNPRWKAFTHKADALNFVNSGEFNSFVVKFTETNRGLRTTVCDDVADALHVLGKLQDGEVVIEERVDGHELAMACYWDGQKFIPTVTTIEHKHLWPGGKGILTPEMGTLVWYDPMPKFMDAFNALLNSPTALYALKDYRGFIDINAIVTDDGDIVPLEFTARFGVPQTDIMTALLNTPVRSYGEFLLSIATGKGDPTLLHHLDKFAVGIVLAVCGYPYNMVYPDICNIGSPIRGFDQVNCHHTYGMVKEENGRLVTAGAWIGCITGIGESVEQAQKQSLLNARKVSFQDIVYREDIGDCFDPYFFESTGLMSEALYAKCCEVE